MASASCRSGERKAGGLVNGGASSLPKGAHFRKRTALIAAAAHAAAAVLATGNPRHFPMRGIEVEHWPVGK